MKKRFLFKILSTFAFFATIGNVSAANNALLVGANYGNINTIPDVTNASPKLYALGYTPVSSTSPTISWMKGTSNGTKRMESSILFFSGHGNSSLMHFYKDNSTDSSYDFTITAGSNSSSVVGLSSYNMSKVKLAVFAGCETAKGTSNITKSAYSKGASGSLGWKESIGASSHTEWLKNFWTDLSMGHSLAVSVAYANSFSYADSRVKQTSYFGGLYSYKVLGAPSVMYTTTSLSNFHEKMEKPLFIKLTSQDESSVKNSINSLLKDNYDTNFILSNYNVEVSQSNDTTIYDYNYIIDGKIKTTLGYTIFVKNGYINQVFDNTDGKKFDELSNAFYLKYSDVNIDELVNELPNSGSFLYYNDNTLYKVIVNEIVNSDGTSYVTQDFVEI